MTEKSTLKKSATLAAAGLVVAGALLAGCGESKAAPMDDAYAGNSGETEKSQEEQSQSQSNGSDSSDGSDSSSSHNDPSTTTSDKKDTGNYKDGNYSINGQYGPVGEDSIDVHLTIKDGNVETVNIIGHPFTTISKNHQDDFAKAINGVVDGKPLKGLKVDKVAGAAGPPTLQQSPRSRPPGGFDSGVRPLLQQCWPQQIGHARGPGGVVVHCFALDGSYATKDPIIVDNSNFSSTSSRNTPCATPCLRNAPTRSSHGVTTWSTMCWKNSASLDNTMPTRLTSMSLSRTQSTNRCNSCVKCSRVGLGTGSESGMARYIALISCSSSSAL